MRIDLLMTPGVVFLDMFKIRGLAEGGVVPVQIPDPGVQVRVSGADVADVAFEVLHVDDVEADDGRVQADVEFRELGAEVVGADVVAVVGAQVRFGAV